MGPPPRVLGRYEILEELGRGATTIAYRARDPELDRNVVVKALVLPSDTDAERSAFEARFLEEARRASLLSHPCLVATHDCGKDEASRTLFVVQELVAGRSLAETLVPGEPRPWDEALSLVGRLAQALQQVHAAGLVHRDVRPTNILLDGATPRLADSGVARFESARLTLTNLRQAFGEPLYSSPEQAVGERVDARADLFALGAVAYRLLTGRDAFAAESPQKILARVIHDRPRPPSALVPNLPAGLDHVLAKALAKSRKDRYADANALCDDLDDLLAGRPPRHAGNSRETPDTARFLADAASRVEAGQGTATGSMQVGRRRVVRASVGLGALVLVGALELLRRELEAPATAPAGRPEVGLEPQRLARTPDSVPDLPALDEQPKPTAHLAIDFKHTLERGTLVVSVDGAPVLERRVVGAVKKSLLGIKLREGRVREVVELPPGRHEVVVRVVWDEGQRTETIAGNFMADGTRRLSARLGRIGKPLSVEWE